MKSLIPLLLIAIAFPAFGKDSKPAKVEKKSEAPATALATFAGGCFWCMQPPFDKMKGVLSTVVGYTGGAEKNPTYQQVSSGTTGHAESVQVTYDPKVVTYEELLNTFWRNINPTQVDGQFADHGKQYRTEIFYHSDEQRIAAEKSKNEIAKKFEGPIATRITKAGPFYPAEDYHQKYYQKDPDDYNRYRVGSGRAGYIEKTWGVKEKKK